MMRYDEKKKNENIMDFDDMEHFALDLLIDHYDEQGNPVPSKIAKEKSDGYEEIYIDEYQDSNYIQDAILRSVSKEAEGGHNMFMVGDVKQSIYVPPGKAELFLEKYHGYQQKGEEYQLIELRNNFRSRSEMFLPLLMMYFTRSCMKILETLNIRKMLLLFQRWSLNKDVMPKQRSYF